MKKIILSWSGGKDSALALHALLRDERYKVVGLLTTVTEEYDRISMHGVRITLLDQQAKALSLPLYKVQIPKVCDNEIYEQKMEEQLIEIKQQGIDTIAFGDLFLEDLKQYREEKLAQIGMKAIFPLWNKKTDALAREFVELGFKAYLSCIDTKHLNETFAGRLYDHQLLNDLPDSVDPCGENGEFHSFVFDGPIFSEPLNIKLGKKKMLNNYCFSDFF